MKKQEFFNNISTFISSYNHVILKFTIDPICLSLQQKELDKHSAGQDDQQSPNESRVSAWVQATGAINAKRYNALWVNSILPDYVHAGADPGGSQLQMKGNIRRFSKAFIDKM